jgi:DNA-binding CsgD family transcriptional regulator
MAVLTPSTKAVAEGKNTLAIAKALCLTRKIVNGYRNRLLEKLYAQTDVELMLLAIRYGLLRVPGTASVTGQKI